MREVLSVSTFQPIPGVSVDGARRCTSVRRQSDLLYFQYRSDCLLTGTFGKTLSAMKFDAYWMYATLTLVSGTLT